MRVRVCAYNYLYRGLTYTHTHTHTHTGIYSFQQPRVHWRRAFFPLTRSHHCAPRKSRCRGGDKSSVHMNARPTMRMRGWRAAADGGKKSERKIIIIILKKNRNRLINSLHRRGGSKVGGNRRRCPGHYYTDSCNGFSAVRPAPERLADFRKRQLRQTALCREKHENKFKTHLFGT